MKRILTVSLAALLLILSVQPVAAASGFSLYQGEISGNYLGNALLGEIFKNMRIDAVFSEENQTYRLSGTAEAKSAEYEIPYGKDGPFVGSSTGTGKLWGTYDPLTGGFGGFIQFDEVFNGTRKDETLTSNVFTMGAHFTGLANYGDINVDLAFAGGVGTDGTNQSVSFSVTFAVQGTLPFTQEPTDEPEETESTFTGNAKLKAVYAAERSGLVALADDSGLCVDALNGDPGVYTANWAGPDRDWSMAMRLVEEKLQALGANTPEKRRANFNCTLCVAWPHGEVQFFEGRVYGHLTWPPRGTRGFGYDPMFVPDGETQTFGEMDPARKTLMSHRGRAFGRLVDALL